MQDKLINKSYTITVGEYKIEVVRKKIKNLILTVYPPDGRIRVSVPLHLDEESMLRQIDSRMGWIKKHISGFEQQERISREEYKSGEIHYLEGKRYILNVIGDSSLNMIKLRDGAFIDLYEKPGSPIRFRPLMLQEWHRARLKARAEPLIRKWQEIIGVEVNEWAIKNMKTRWGTCNIRAKRIWLNLELAKRSDACLEYIVVHELVHLLERLHNARFKALMDQYLPDWRARKDSMRRVVEPGSHEPYK